MLIRSFLVGASLLCALPAAAAECPKEINPCKVIFVTPQEYQWLVGQPTDARESAIDYAAKAIGANGAPAIGQLIMRLRAAQDGSAPKEPQQ